jgi:hypothetical protein
MEPNAGWPGTLGTCTRYRSTQQERVPTYLLDCSALSPVVAWGPANTADMYMVGALRVLYSKARVDISVRRSPRGHHLDWPLA